MPPSLPSATRHILDVLKKNGHEAFLVGGCVRDLLLKRTPKDYDIATSTLPDQIEALFPKTLDIGKAFGIIAVVTETGEKPIEVATYRADAPYADGRHPEGVTFTHAREDALRRDFTINALFMDPDSGEILDYAEGRDDIDAKLIRAIGDAKVRFGEDHLRMLRAVRFASTLGFTIEPKTFAAIQALAPQIQRISAERIRDELFRLLTESKKAGEALELLRESGLLKEVLPEIEAMIGVEQPPEFHPEGDVFIHTRLMLDGLPENPSLELALAVLFHDVGKPPTANLITLPDGTPRWRFECHASVGANMTREILNRLRAPNALIDEVCTVIGNHMRMADAPKMRKAKLRRLIGAPTFENDLALHRLDCLSSHSLLTIYDFLLEAREDFAAEPVLPTALVTGRDLIDRGHKPGPEFSKMLQTLYDRQLEGETDKEALLASLPPPKD